MLSAPCFWLGGNVGMRMFGPKDSSGHPGHGHHPSKNFSLLQSIPKVLKEKYPILFVCCAPGKLKDVLRLFLGSSSFKVCQHLASLVAEMQQGDAHLCLHYLQQGCSCLPMKQLHYITPGLLINFLPTTDSWFFSLVLF